MAHSKFNKFITTTIAAEINRFSKYYDLVMQIAPLEDDKQRLLEEIQCKEKTTVDGIDSIHSGEAKARRVLLLNGNLNYENDIEPQLNALFEKMSRSDRVVCVLFNPYFRWLYRLADLVGLRKVSRSVTFVTRSNIQNLCKLCGFEVVKLRTTAYSPFRLWGAGDFINRILPTIPLIKWLSIATVVVLRPIKVSEDRPSLSIVIPARNEAGNIENALIRMPELEGVDVEVIFVEGNSTDNTWSEIQRVVAMEKYRKYSLVALQQTGKGKKDAVMLGFNQARGELLTILDADLTMPPESLPRFYEAYRSGTADMVNGNRLMYPMEDEAMRFLNRLGNLFFAKTLSRVLDISIGDSLCGTKMISREDHYRFLAWLEDFGEFDPFGDFQLLFPSSDLCLGTVDIPITYGARTYGSTNIDRFRHGWMLLKMTAQGFIKIKAGAVAKRSSG
ncbi:MAG: glycosyltransferase [Gammaproteobacteria bacterium]|nr:glycosyltransferase [Gammaproteobacteria bacterium]